jgi:hypothetical protein
MNATLRRASNIVGWLCCTALLAVTALFIWYLIDNNTNHTGFPLKTLRIGLMATSIATLLAFIAFRAPSLIAAACLGFAMVAGLYYLDRNNILLEYGEWIKRGMPAHGASAR